MVNSVSEIIAFVLYLASVLAVGIVFFVKSKKSDGGDKDYFLGGREMNGFVAALSAGASDMSAWVLMGLPGSIYAFGMGQVWISVGLLIGTALSWIFIAPNLRRYSIAAKDSITVPQYLTNRFLSDSKVLQVICAVIFLIAYCVYAASSIVACGSLFNTVFGMKNEIAMIGATIVILVYTFLGGFNAVCWTDFIQGLLMLGALMAVPIITLFIMQTPSFAPLAEVVTPEHYYSLLSSGAFDWASISDILSGLGWGLGYAGMPHIVIRYMSIKSEREMKKSQVVGTTWTALILIMASVVALVAHEYLGTYLPNDNRSLVFITLVRDIFGKLGGSGAGKVIMEFIAGILLSAILAASMSTADSQLLASSSAFASDVYKPVFRKNASNKEMMWAGRIIVIAISIIALLIAMSPKCAGIMALVECAWAAFGASFGPVIILSLYWKRLTYKGAVAGIVVGFLVDALWYAFLSGPTNLYEIIPGAIAGLLAGIIVSLIDKAPSQDVIDLFNKAKLPTERED